MKQTISANDFREQKQPGKSKYRNKWVTIDGIKFQSIKEGNYYLYLKDAQRAGNIQRFERQVSYKLEVNGVHICKYIADFVVYFFDGTYSVIDVKGEITKYIQTYRLKKSLMLAIFGIVIREV